MRAAVILLALAACWTGPHVVETPAPTPKKRVVVRTKPTCWTTQFYEAWPVERDLYDVVRECEAQWPGDYVAGATCVAHTMSMAYVHLWYHVRRWWESCA